MAPEPKLSPIDAEANHARRRAQLALWRLTAWGCAAAVALVAAAFATQTPTGAQRLQLALAGRGNPDNTAMLAAAERRADEAQAQVRQLAAEVRKLAAERQRLDARLAGIERDFNDLTGALGEQKKEAAEAAQAAKSARTAALAPTKLAPLTLIAPLTLPGGVSALAPWPDQTPQPKTATEAAAPHPVKTIAVTRPQKAQAPAAAATEAPKPAKTASAPAATEPPPPAEAAPSAPDEQVASAKPAASPDTPPKLGAPPQTVTVAPLPTATVKPAPKIPTVVRVPMPPVRVAALPSERTTAPSKPEFGIDISGASSIALLRARWGEVKARFGPQVVGLHPLIAHDRHAGHLPYRLVIGPLPTSAAATELCAQFGLARGLCRPARFVGEPLARR